MFKNKYRVVTCWFIKSNFEAQVKFWWFPIWWFEMRHLQIGCCMTNTHESREAAEKFILSKDPDAEIIA